MIHFDENAPVIQQITCGNQGTLWYINFWLIMTVLYGSTPGSSTYPVYFDYVVRNTAEV